MFRRVSAIILTAALSWIAAPGVRADNPYPVISALTNDDVVYGQLEDDISTYYQAISSGDAAPALGFYLYRTGKYDDLYDIAARANIPYETIATANDIERPEELHAGAELLLANVPGIFVPRSPNSDLDLLMAASHERSSNPGVPVTLYTSRGPMAYQFFPGARFDPLERAYFLGVLFRFPLDRGIVTSNYGMRVDPFSGRMSFHSGIDLAAPWGSNVYAARDGTVEYVGHDSTYGNYVLLRHGGGYETLYGHLSSTAVQLNDRVTSGMIIGKVGSTGLSTGPHLHFEIRERGRAEDPAPLLPIGGS